MSAQKKVAAIRFEGTLTSGADPDVMNLGTVIPGVAEKTAKLYETHEIIVMSSVVKYPGGVKRVWDFLISNNIAFTDVWCLDGLPSADVWIDNEAVKL